MRSCTDERGGGAAPRIRGRGSLVSALAACVVGLAACDGCSSEKGGATAGDQAVGGDAGAEMAAKTPSAAMTFEVRAVAGRRYRLFGAAPGWRWAITSRRPDAADAAVALVVAGTYTSPDDTIEGLFVVDGVVEGTEVRSWEGALVIEQGRARLERVAPGAIEGMGRRMASSGGSLLQGHLLVDAGARLPLKDSAALQRRAFVELEGRALVAEGFGAVPLRSFADDLVALGAARALNLDMGKWSGGWYRTRDGGRAPLGHDHRATDRQSSWVVLRGD